MVAFTFSSCYTLENKTYRHVTGNADRTSKHVIKVNPYFYGSLSIRTDEEKFYKSEEVEKSASSDFFVIL